MDITIHNAAWDANQNWCNESNVNSKDVVYHFYSVRILNHSVCGTWFGEWQNFSCKPQYAKSALGARHSKSYRNNLTIPSIAWMFTPYPFLKTPVLSPIYWDPEAIPTMWGSYFIAWSSKLNGPFWTPTDLAMMMMGFKKKSAEM